MEAELDVDSIDPALAGRPGHVVAAPLCHLREAPELPGQVRPGGSRLIPEVAEALPARSADGKTYTFTIRPGFRFSPPSNQPVTAQTFKDTIERTLDPRMKSAYGAGVQRHRRRRRRTWPAKRPTSRGIVVRGNQLAIHLLAPAG